MGRKSLWDVFNDVCDKHTVLILIFVIGFAWVVGYGISKVESSIPFVIPTVGNSFYQKQCVYNAEVIEQTPSMIKYFVIRPASNLRYFVCVKGNTIVSVWVRSGIVH